MTPPLYAAEKVDPLKEATIFIKRLGATEATKDKIISELGLSEDTAQALISEHRNRTAEESRSRLKDRLLLILCGLSVGLVVGLLLFFSAPKAAFAGTLPFIVMVWVGVFFFFGRRRS